MPSERQVSWPCAVEWVGQWLTRASRFVGIIKRYCEGFFTPNYKLTIGVDFAVKVVEWDDRTRVSLQVRRLPWPLPHAANEALTL